VVRAAARNHLEGGCNVGANNDLEADCDEETSEGRRWTETCRDVDATENCQTAANRSADGGGAQVASSGLLRKEQREDQSRSREIDLETRAKAQRRIAAVRRRERRKSSWADNAQTTEQHTKVRVGRRRASESTNDETEKKNSIKTCSTEVANVQNPKPRL
jgi:hypothetical protein